MAMVQAAMDRAVMDQEGITARAAMMARAAMEGQVAAAQEDQDGQARPAAPAFRTPPFRKSIQRARARQRRASIRKDERGIIRTGVAKEPISGNDDHRGYDPKEKKVPTPTPNANRNTHK